MKNNKNLLLIFYLVIQLSCTTKPAIKEYDVNPILKARVLSSSKSAQPVKLALCDKIPFKWDSIIILPPYSNAEIVKNQNLVNSGIIEKMFPELTLDEGRCILLFVENNNIVRYSFVPRVPLDFNKILMPEKTNFKISKEVACNQLYIKKESDKFILAY